MDQLHLAETIQRKVHPGKAQDFRRGFDPDNRSLADNPGCKRADIANPGTKLQQPIAGTQMGRNRVGFLMFIAPKRQRFLDPATQVEGRNFEAQATQGKNGHTCTSELSVNSS